MNNEYDIMFLGCLFPKEIEEEINKNTIGVVDNAANSLQWKVVRGFDINMKMPIKIITSLHLGSYPRKYKQMCIKELHFNHEGDSCDISVGYTNLSLYKHYSRLRKTLPHVRVWADTKNKRQKVMIVYGMSNVFYEIIKSVKSINKNVIIVNIVADLPQFMNTTNKIGNAYKILKKFSVYHIIKNINKVDGFVFLTIHMSEYLGINMQKSIIMEGVSRINSDIDNMDWILNKENINIVYTGTLHERYNIKDLILAFKKIVNDNYRLIICGSGDSEEYVRETVEKDKRVIFLGQINQQIVAELQCQATILVNPRQNNEEFTKYSFPSKNIEYLQSGRPLIAYKLDGVPDEYDKYIIYVNDNSVEALSKKIIEVAEYTNEIREKIGYSAKKWITKEKNEIVQVKRILKMIEEIMIEKNR